MLTDAEYQQIMRCKAANQSRINALTKNIKVLVAQAAVMEAHNDTFKEEMELYNNFLSNDIKEYEDAHPVEEPK